MRFVGLGDSLTQGVGDPRPGRPGFSGQLHGWVEYFADAIRSSGQTVEVRNLALAGARLEHVLAEQLEPALRLQPDLASCIVGVNDLWDVNLDTELFAQRFDRVFSALTASVPVVMSATIHDVFAPYPMRAALRNKLNANIAELNAIIRSYVARHGVVLIDFEHRSEMFTRAVRAIDGLHPNRYGHQLIAAEALAVLQAAGNLPAVAPPAATPVRRGAHDLAHIAWVGSYTKRNWKRWRAEMAENRAKAARITDARPGA